jgi:outer membrane protein assembly factor BamB
VEGPSDGTIQDSVHPLKALPQEPKILWEIQAGPGQSSPSLSQGRVVFMDGIDGQEVVHCLDAAQGKELWKANVGPMVEFQNAYGEGPRCTPLIDEDRLYVQSCGGEFRCLSLSDGKQRWAIGFGRSVRRHLVWQQKP